MSDKKQWIVITSGDEPMETVLEALAEKGFTVEATLDAIGQIIGRSTDAVKNEALKVKGVAGIQPSQDISIGPPDSEFTW